MKSKLITVPQDLLEDILPQVKNTPLEKRIKTLLENTDKYQTQNISYFPKKGKVKRVIDGDAVVLENGSIVRYIGITSPKTNELFEKESTDENKKLVEGKTVSLEYDNYKGDKFSRILAYLVLNGKNISAELAKKGLAQVVIYKHKKPWIYQEQLLKAQEEAKKNISNNSRHGSYNGRNKQSYCKVFPPKFKLIWVKCFIRCYSNYSSN